MNYLAILEKVHISTLDGAVGLQYTGVRKLMPTPSRSGRRPRGFDQQGREAHVVATAYRAYAERALFAFLKKRTARVRRQAPTLLPIVRTAAEFVTRPAGKRLRGYLVTIGFQLVRGTRPAQVLRWSLAAELAHASLLIHDDIIDQDERRRGGPTVHAALRKRMGEHDATSQALLVGSLLGIFARELLMEGDVAPSRRLRALRVLEWMMHETHVGEMLDVHLASVPSATRVQVEAVHRLKTTAYSIEGPLLLGAALAGASPALETTLRKIARPAGSAFQIQDDLLGLFGNSRVTGKAVGADLKEGKKTLLTVDVLARTRGAQRARVRRLLARRARQRGDVATIREIARTTGAARHSERLAEQRLARARRVLADARRIDRRGAILLDALLSSLSRRSA